MSRHNTTNCPIVRPEDACSPQDLITGIMQTYLLLCAFTERFLAYLSLRSWPVIGTGAGRGGKRKSAAPSCGLSCHDPCR
jgi:hypothetical protein